MKVIVSYKPYDYKLTVYLSDVFPLFKFSGWCITLLGIAFVKYTYYKNAPTVICWDITPEQDAEGYGSTHRTCMHEYSHVVLKKQIGTIKYGLWCVWCYVILFWVKHDDKKIEQRVEEIMYTLINPY